MSAHVDVYGNLRFGRDCGGGLSVTQFLPTHKYFKILNVTVTANFIIFVLKIVKVIALGNFNFIYMVLLRVSKINLMVRNF